MEFQPIARSLAEHPLVNGMSGAHLDFLSGCARNERLSAGHYLFREGQPADSLYLVRSGKIALEIHDPARGALVVESLGQGDAIGWTTLVPPYRWGVDARAIEPSVLLAIDGKCLRSKLEADHEFGYAFTLRLLHEVHQRLERARLQVLDVYGSRP
jgi:CRP-like cAMP-binding protein